MSSLPPQRPLTTSQRQSSAEEPPATDQTSESDQQQRRASPSKSTSSVDSQTVLLNNSSEQGDTETTEEAVIEQRQSRAQSTKEEPQKCWICFADETEDSPTSSRWRSPCSCALTAHESCLLDWVADLEAPSSRKRLGAPAKIQCPQCKKDIVIARPKNYIVEGVKRIDRAVSRLVLPGVALSLVGSLYAGATIHGVATVWLVFGSRDFEMLVRDPTRLSPSWLLGFPTIPVVLMMSRTSFANGILPAMPVFFFIGTMAHPAAQYAPYHPARTFAWWPPSAAMSFALLPYVQGFYNAVYKRLFAERERRWMKEVQPRAGQNTEGDADGDHHHHHHGGFGLDLDLEVEIVNQVVEERPPEQPARQIDGQPQGQNVQQDAAGNNVGEQNRDQGQPGNQRADQAQIREVPLAAATSRIANVMMGALCFPAVASAMGELLKLGLPSKWTEPSWRRPGFLQTKWGRTIAGGCLFIVMKDTLLLYSKYRTARDHRLRRIMNYDKRTGQHVV
ncbi:hypothetical protein MMC10_002106 [Thelotrema lepadinum]|nr:hypothetical protein [Thelotrema lepadinum]